MTAPGAWQTNFEPEVAPAFFSTLRVPSPQLHWEGSGREHGDMLAAAAHQAMMDIALCSELPNSRFDGRD